MADRNLEKEVYDLALHTGRQRFFPISGSAYQPFQDFGIIVAGQSFHRPPFAICRLAFNQHSLYFCISGQAEYVTPRGRGSLHPGEMWSVPANYPHHYWTDSEWGYVWVHFRDDWHWHDWFGDADAKLPSHRIDMMAKVADAMLEHGARWQDDETMTAWTRLFVLYLDRELQNPDDQASQWHARLSAVWREVRLDPARSWRAGDLADLAHMSPTSFNRAVRKIHGASPAAMLARIRLENALVLMRHTGMTLDRIAMLCGYSTGFALSKGFQRVFGKSPRRMAAEATPD